MNFEILLAIGLILLFLVLMLVFTILGMRKPWRDMRPIPAFSRFGNAIGCAVEAGNRLHICLGRGSITNSHSAVGFVGLSMLRRLTQVASASDAPPVASSGDGALAILSQSTLKSTYSDLNASQSYTPDLGRVAGLTPFSFAAGTLPINRDEKVSASALIGSFGAEIVLILDASERSNVFTLAGTDNIPAQAILYAAAQEPLIGEEVFAGGAYINAGPAHTASLRVQDIFRWIIVSTIVLGSLLQLFGF